MHAVRRTGRPSPKFNYELFNCNNFNIRYWSWNYRGCWPHLVSIQPVDCPQLRMVGASLRALAFEGIARSLSPRAGAFARITAATARRGIALGSPELGHLAGIRPPTVDAQLAEPQPDCVWRQPCARSTRLALQLFLVKGFKLYSFRLQDPKEPCISIAIHYISESELCNLRACCLPWMCWLFLRPTLRNHSLKSRYPLNPW